MGKVHGTYLWWYANGNIKVKCEFVMGKKHGRSINWDSFGRLCEDCIYFNGIKLI
jgi:antitoxin component YwqK of YwqJK toxin-antitoxin module